jgi:AcrR family transcriptional regulator
MPEDEALEEALLLFWDKGYERTSITDLGAAIGVGPSSIYNAFGSKEELYRKALARYMQTHAAFVAELLEEPSTEPIAVSLRKLLRGLVRLYTGTHTPRGCALLQSGGAGSPTDSTACAITLEIKSDLVQVLQKRLRAHRDELLATPRVLAQFVLATMRGLSQLAADGASRADLLKVADLAAQSCARPSKG